MEEGRMELLLTILSIIGAHYSSNISAVYSLNVLDCDSLLNDCCFEYSFLIFLKNNCRLLYRSNKVSPEPVIIENDQVYAVEPDFD